MVSDQGLDGSGVPDGWAPDGIMAGVPDLNAAAAQSTLGAVMSPDQMADVNWGDSDAPAPTIPEPAYFVAQNTDPGPAAGAAALAAGTNGSSGTLPAGADWSGSGAAGGAAVIGPSQVTSSEGGDAGALTREINSLDPRLSPVLGQMHWVAVPNSVDQDDDAHIDPDQKPRGYPDQGYGSNLTYGDVDGTYDPNTKDVIIATNGGNAGDGSYNTVFHETAHDMDGPDAAQSNSAGFQKAYNADTPLMTPGEDDYYLNKASGPSEAYAESFARYFGGDPTLQQDWPNMYNYWAGQYPNVSPGQPWKWSVQPEGGN